MLRVERFCGYTHKNGSRPRLLQRHLFPPSPLPPQKWIRREQWGPRCSELTRSERSVAAGRTRRFRRVTANVTGYHRRFDFEPVTDRTTSGTRTSVCVVALARATHTQRNDSRIRWPPETTTTTTADADDDDDVHVFPLRFRTPPQPVTGAAHTAVPDRSVVAVRPSRHRHCRSARAPSRFPPSVSDNSRAPSGTKSPRGFFFCLSRERRSRLIARDRRRRRLYLSARRPR